jgi:hypothetical protein
MAETSSLCLVPLVTPLPPDAVARSAAPDGRVLEPAPVRNVGGDEGPLFYADPRSGSPRRGRRKPATATATTAAYTAAGRRPERPG